MATSSISKTHIIIGRTLSALAVAFLLFDSVIHFMKIQPVVEAFAQLGYPIELAIPIAVVELVCILTYIYPKTSVLGAILLTGYLGGAVASNLRVENPLFSHTLFPVYVGIFIWGGIFARNNSLRQLFPFIKDS